MSTGKVKKRKNKRRSVTAAAVYSIADLCILGPASADQAREKAAGQNRSQRKSTANWVKQHCTMHLAGEAACHIYKTHPCQRSWSEVALCCQCQGRILFCMGTHLFIKLYTKQEGLKCWCWDFCRHAEAITLLLAVIREAPNLPDAYHTLGLLYESQGDAKKALDFHMISAHLSKVWTLHVAATAATTMLYQSTTSDQKLPQVAWHADHAHWLNCLQDSQVWKRIAKMSTDLGYLRQAIYCLKNVS